MIKEFESESAFNFLKYAHQCQNDVVPVAGAGVLGSLMPSFKAASTTNDAGDRARVQLETLSGWSTSS